MLKNFSQIPFIFILTEILKLQKYYPQIVFKNYKKKNLNMFILSEKSADCGVAALTTNLRRVIIDLRLQRTKLSWFNKF